MQYNIGDVRHPKPYCRRRKHKTISALLTQPYASINNNDNKQTTCKHQNSHFVWINKMKTLQTWFSFFMRIRYEKLFPSCWWEKLLIFHSVFQSFNKCELEWSNTKSSSVLIERDGWDVSTACQLSTSLFMYTCIQALLQVGDLWFSTKNKKRMLNVRK